MKVEGKRRKTTKSSSQKNGKKARERKFLAECADLYRDFPRGEVIDGKDKNGEPDFLIRTDSGVVGIEIADYVRRQKMGEGSGGSVLRSDERNREKVIDLAEKKYQTRDKTRLYVALDWVYEQHLKRAEVQTLADCLVDVVARSVPEYFNSGITVGAAELSRTPLRTFVNSIFIMKSVPTAFSLWSKAESGPTETKVEELQTLSSDKEKKLDKYTEHCSFVWLLIVADGEHLSSSVYFPNGVTKPAFTTRFAKVIFYDRRERRVVGIAGS